MAIGISCFSSPHGVSCEFTKSIFCISSVSFPKVTRVSNRCICEDTCGVCTCSLVTSPGWTCEYYKYHRIENLENFKMVVEGMAMQKLTSFFEDFVSDSVMYK